MKYTKRQIESRAGMTREEALLSLQEHPEFQKRNMKIADIKRRRDRWVATVFEPKHSGTPPFAVDEEEPESPKPESLEFEDEPKDLDSLDDLDDSEDEGEKDEKSEDKDLSEVLDLVKAIADALGVSTTPKGLDDLGGPGPGPDAEAPLPPPPPSKKGPSKLKPGELPNTPGVTPVGAPAFAKTQAAGRVATFTATAPVSEFRNIKEAKASLDEEYGPMGYTVKQIKRHDDKVVALLSVR